MISVRSHARAAAVVVILGLASIVLPVSAAGATSGRTGGRSYRQITVPRAGHRIVVRDYPGAEPALVLMHGLPDSMRLYDRVVPLLRGRRTVTFDFLGWGRSEKPHGYPYTFANQLGDLDAVVRGLRLRRPVLVPHDASGPTAINWALAHPDNVGGLGLLNTFYELNPDTLPPQGVAIFAGLLDIRRTPNGPRGTDYLAPLRREIIRNRRLNHELYLWQIGRFITSPRVRRQVLPAFWRDFCCEEGSFSAFRRLNTDIIPTLLADVPHLPELRTLRVPVSIIWGRHDPYLTAALARRFAQDFPHAGLHLLNAQHYVQIDQPRQVARLLARLG